MIQYLILIGFGCMVWAGVMTLLYMMARHELRQMQAQFADMQRGASNAATIERYYQAKVSKLVGSLRMVAPWMLQENDKVML